MKLPFPLQESERVLVVCRRHWLFLYPWLTVLTLVALVPVVVLFLFLGVADALEGVGLKVAVIVSAVWLLLWGVRLFLFKYRYDNDIWVITNQRIIDSVRTTPLSLVVATADLIDVVDTSVNRSGLLRTLLDYGDIECETAGERRDFSLTAVPRPREMHALIDRERDRERKAVYAGQGGRPSAQAPS